jgi:hypothetical protein
MDTTASNKGPFLIREEHRPQEGQDYRARALFLTAGLGILCSRLLKNYIDHCEADGKKAEPAISMDEYTLAVKEILSISIWLTLFEQSAHATIPEWFKSFIIDCHNIADKVQPNPPAKEIQTRYTLGSPMPEICLQLSFNLCNQLRLGTTANDAMLYLGEITMRTVPDRNELLQFALTAPVAALDERIRQA